MKNLRLKKSPLSVKIIIIFFFMFFLLWAIIHLFPIFWSISNSLKSGQEYFDDNMGLPNVWRFGNYIKVFTEFRARGFYYMDMLWNSVWVIVVSVVVNILSSALLAYPVARYDFPGKELLYTVVIFANIIPIIGNGPATFKMMNALGMINNPWTIWFSWASGFDFAFIVFYGNFKGISQTYSEAAKLDGANDWLVFIKIIMPQAFPCVMALMINSAINSWNDYTRSMLYLRDYPNLAYGLYLFEAESNYIEDSKPIFFAASVISSIPVIVLYACSQKLILTNITAGGLKG